MFQLDLGGTSPYCDGLGRRSFLKLGVAGMATLGLPGLLRARADSEKAMGVRKNTSVILIWLDGGPPQHETYDPKLHLRRPSFAVRCGRWGPPSREFKSLSCSLRTPA